MEQRTRRIQYIVSYHNTKHKDENTKHKDEEDCAATKEKVERFMTSQKYALVKNCHCLDFDLWEGSEGAKPIGQPPGPTTQGEPIGNIGFCENKEISNALISCHSKDQSSITPQPDKKLPAVKIGVVDTGVEFKYTGITTYFAQTNKTICSSDMLQGDYGIDLLSNSNAEPQDELGHGTLVNGILMGFATPSPIENTDDFKFEILNAQYAKKDSFSLFDALCGMAYSINQGCKILNISWAAYSSNYEEMRNLFLPILELAKANNVLIVAGAGNNNVDMRKPKSQKAWPAAFSHYPDPLCFNNFIISVGGLQKGTKGWKRWNERTQGSNYGLVDVFAPAVVEHGLGLNLARVTGAGTSFATPYITRRAALIKAKNTSLAPSEIKRQILEESAVISGLRAYLS